MFSFLRPGLNLHFGRTEERLKPLGNAWLSTQGDSRFQPTSQPHASASSETKEMPLPLAPPDLSQGASHLAGSALHLPLVLVLIAWGGRPPAQPPCRPPRDLTLHTHVASGNQGCKRAQKKAFLGPRSLGLPLGGSGAAGHPFTSEIILLLFSPTRR